MNTKTINKIATLFAIVPLFLLQSSLAQEVASESQVAAAEADSALNRLSFSQWVKDFEKQFKARFQFSFFKNPLLVFDTD